MLALPYHRLPQSICTVIVKQGQDGRTVGERVPSACGPVRWLGLWGKQVIDYFIFGTPKGGEGDN
jgi:hypothetical protein